MTDKEQIEARLARYREAQAEAAAQLWALQITHRIQVDIANSALDHANREIESLEAELAAMGEK